MGIRKLGLGPYHYKNDLIISIDTTTVTDHVPQCLRLYDSPAAEWHPGIIFRGLVVICHVDCECHDVA